jgi:hypothetical protein
VLFADMTAAGVGGLPRRAETGHRGKRRPGADDMPVLPHGDRPGQVCPSVSCPLWPGSLAAVGESATRALILQVVCDQ